MKKIISVLLSVIMVFSLVSVAAAADEKLIITVANDLHYNHQAATAPAAVTKDFAHVPQTGQLKYESELIIDAFLEAAAANESSVVLLPGDITDTGAEKEYAVMAEKLKAFEESSGKSVYVVPGNHETQFNAEMDIAAFVEYFADFGYNEAIAKDTNSASYVVDLGDDYRLLAIDSTKAGEGVHGMTKERAAWIEAQAAQAQKDGKKTIAMMHHNLIEHLILGNTLHTASVIEESYGLQETFTKYNVKYNFVGHTHEHDIASYTGSNGNTFYSIVTGSLNAYPCPYRVVTFGDKVKIETRNVDSVDMSSLEDIISENCYNLATSDFEEYARQCFSAGFAQIMDSYLNASRLQQLLGLNANDDPEICKVIDKLAPTIREAVYMPIYVADETEDGKSLEAIAARLNLDIPKTDYKNFGELALFLYAAHVAGDENYGFLSTEYVLLTGVITAFLNYVLNNIEAADYANALTFLCTKLNINIPVNFYNYAATEIKRAEGIEFVLSAGLNAVLLQFTTDGEPKDNNVSLPGFDAPAEKDPSEMTLWEKIVNFFKSFFENILRFFGVGKY